MPGCRRVRRRWPARLGATQITHGFLPGAVLARAIGRQDCLGATMCLRRRDLERIGGLQALVDHLADDNVLGRRIAGLGLRVALADTVPLTTVPEADCPGAVPARTALGADDPGAGAGGVRRLGAAVSAGLGAADGRAGRRCALVDRAVPGRLGAAGGRRPGVDRALAPLWARQNAAAMMTRSPCILAARSGFCRCETSCRWP